MTENMTQRRVVAWTSVSLDGYTSGPDGPEHDSWLYEHAMKPQTTAYFESVWRGVSTALLGRTNYVGFHSVWPGITADPETDERTRALGRWLNDVEKVVFSRTLEKAEWNNSRISDDLEGTVRELKAQDGGDIMIVNSVSIIQQLLAADLVDDLRFAIVPAMVGGGLRLFGEGLPESRWALAETTALEHGAVGLHYRRG